jgi:hypothetical protein
MFTNLQAEREAALLRRAQGRVKAVFYTVASPRAAADERQSWQVGPTSQICWVSDIGTDIR